MDREPRNKDIVTINDLPRWELSADSEQNVDASEKEPVRGIKFPCNRSINTQITLWMGDLRVLDVDAVVNSTNETLTENVGVSGSLLEAGGSELRDEIAKSEQCRTGEAKITKAYNIAARYIIHTVGPRYNDKYKTAAENALHNCYRSCLSVLKEQSLKTIAFPVVNSIKRGYPPEGGAHIAIRTVRRFLEHWGKDIQLIVLCVNNTQDLKLYSKILPLYFPRNETEEKMAKEELPRDTGNEYGETVIEERKIRISAFPSQAPSQSSSFSSSSLSSNSTTTASNSGTTTTTASTTAKTTSSSSTSSNMGSFTSSTPFPKSFEKGLTIDYQQQYDSPLESKLPDKSFVTMKGDQDEMRKRKLQTMSREDQERIAQQQLYQNYLYRAQQMDLSDVARLNVIFESGKDPHGRPIIVIVGHRLPTVRIHLDRVFLYMISIMDRITDNPYTVVYFHTFMVEKDTPEFSWIKQIYEIMDSKYGNHLANFYVVHPTFWLKLLEGLVSTFMVNDHFWTKLRYVDSLEELYNGVSPDQVHVPKEIVTYDVQIHGHRRQTSQSQQQQGKDGVSTAKGFVEDL